MTGAPLADLNNTGKSRKAGACTAAAFLKVLLKVYLFIVKTTFL